MSVEKSMLIRKAMRNFDDIYDAYLVDDEDLVVDEDGNVYALVEKAIWNDKDPKAGLAEAAAGGAGGYIAGRGFIQHQAAKTLQPFIFDNKHEVKELAEQAKAMRIKGKIKMAAGGTLMAGGVAHGINRAVKDKKGSNVGKAVWNDKDPKQGLAEGAVAATGAGLMKVCTGTSKCRCGRHMTGRSRVGMAAGGTMMAGALAHSINRAVKDKKENKM
jgi:hypothetical protein